MLSYTASLISGTSLVSVFVEVVFFQKTNINITKEGSLFIGKMSLNDEGIYTCTPYNILGSSGQSGEILLVAKEPPRFTSTPQKSLEVEIGRSLNLVCTGEGDPEPIINWRKV